MNRRLVLRKPTKLVRANERCTVVALREKAAADGYRARARARASCARGQQTDCRVFVEQTITQQYRFAS